jgi:hypothetical protein
VGVEEDVQLFKIYCNKVLCIVSGIGADTALASKCCEDGGLRNTFIMEQTCIFLAGKR